VTILSPAELETRVRQIGETRYHHLHPFHRRLHSGGCDREQVQAWALNRYYYQAMIPIKDASLIARCEDRAVRRAWRERLADHDGTSDDDEGGIARWLKLTDDLGLSREYVVSTRGILPSTRFAVEAYVHFVRERSLIEAIASSLTELFSPEIIKERLEGMLANYAFVKPETLVYFARRPEQASRDANFALDYVKETAVTEEDQLRVVAALEFKCSILWALLDGIYHAYVEPRHRPPGAFMAGGH